MAECARVLRPGGRLCVSDLTVERDDLPPEIATQPAAWAGCVAGALAEEGFLHKLDRAGFQRAGITTSRRPVVPPSSDSSCSPARTPPASRPP